MKNIQSKRVAVARILAASILVVICALALLVKGIQPISGQTVGESRNQTPVTNDGGKIVGGYQLSAQLDQDVIKSAEQIVLQVVVRNVARDELSYLETYPGFNFEVKNEKGEVIPLTRYGTRIFRPQTVNKSKSVVTRTAITRLNKGEEKKYRFFINDLFDMSVPETYFVTVRKSVVVDGERTEVISNPVKAVVRPFQASQLPNKIPEGQELNEE